MLRTGLVAGLIVCMLASVCFALVETDNPLLGVLKQEGFTVVQDLSFVHAQKSGLPTLEIRDGADNSAYEMSSRLNTMLFSGTHARQLARFVRDRGGVWDGLALEADPEARFLMVRWKMPTSRDAEVYRRQFAEWRSKIAALNKSVYDTLEAWGPDPAGPQSGDVDVVDLGGGVKLEMVYIEPGTFMMGSPKDEAKRDKDETQHRVKLTEGFWIGKYEVTQEQWQRVMGSNPSQFKGTRNPVEQVSWEDSQEFIRKLNSRVTDGGFRLPTEAEWEYACRAGATTPFAFGDCLDTSDANYDGNYPMPGCSKGQYRKKTLSVGSLRANAWGFYDMHGNVWEWCQDWYGDYPSGNVTNPSGPGSGEDRVLRGGSWYSYAWHCRSADRSRYAPGSRDDTLGLRLARTKRP